jgi:hypothetical protein
VNWFDNGKEMKQNAIAKYNSITRTITNIDYYFREGISWSFYVLNLRLENIAMALFLVMVGNALFLKVM